jgi:hypothetical protein
MKEMSDPGVLFELPPLADADALPDMPFVIPTSAGAVSRSVVLWEGRTIRTLLPPATDVRLALALGKLSERLVLAYEADCD